MYRQLIGSLMYLVNTRPEIYFAVSTLNQFMIEPRHEHWAAANTTMYVQNRCPHRKRELTIQKEGIVHHWCMCINELIPTFSFLSFNHIFHQLNQEADRLSKPGLGGLHSILHFKELMGSEVTYQGSINIF